MKILKVAVAVPIYRLFDYLPPADSRIACCQPGTRVKVFFGHRQLVGVVVAVADSSEVPANKLKPIAAILDETPCLPTTLLALARWTSEYYHHPVGEVILHALPTRLRQVNPPQPRQQQLWRATPQAHAFDRALLKRAPAQRALLEYLLQQPQAVNKAMITADGFRGQTLNQLQQKGLVVAEACQPSTFLSFDEQVSDLPKSLNDAQQHAMDAITAQLDEYATFLLQGVTGSGKTEVYLQVIDAVIRQGRQALVLVPEIGLTPQTLSRFQRRFQLPIVVLHSNLSDTQRLAAWQAAASGEAKIIIGTRSAAWVPLPDLGMIILDEEHDVSFKQQEGFRYSARDVLIKRASMRRVPIVLGTATPSFESLHNVQQGRFKQLSLPSRAGMAVEPTFHLIDIRSQSLNYGMSNRLLEEMRNHLAQGNQVLLYINRRGFSPTLLCHSCGWVAECQHCDVKLTYHANLGQLICHHCGISERRSRECQSCGSDNLIAVGFGTERIEQAMQELFPQYETVRIDRDSTRFKGSFDAMLKAIHSGQYQILVGTQMLSKGHHFPDVTLVAILNADAGLMSGDFRASERMAQRIIQVAGRAGRASKPGEVYLQTYNPDSVLLKDLITAGYDGIAQRELAIRSQAGFPPYAHLALVRAQGKQAAEVEQLLMTVKRMGGSDHALVVGPCPSPIQRIAKKHRFQLLVQSRSRKSLHHTLSKIRGYLSTSEAAKRLRWSIDVDPIELF